MSFSYRKNLKHVSNQNMISNSSFSLKKNVGCQLPHRNDKRKPTFRYEFHKKKCAYRTSNGHNVDDQKRPDLTQYLLENVLECCIFCNHIECKRCQKSTITHEYQM